ncbi:MAG: hypothetical protein ABI604_10730 [Nitrospirota bacterium]
MPGFRLFVYQFDEDILKVCEDILSGAPVTIGFNRRKEGLDVSVPLDLQVVKSTIAPDGSRNRRRSDEMFAQIAMCINEVPEQVQKQLEGKYIPCTLSATPSCKDLPLLRGIPTALAQFDG